MKNVLLKVLKEIGIALGILVILLAIVVVAFKDQLPYDEEIRTADEYVKADVKEYSVSSSDRISEVTAVTVTHEAEVGQIVEAENEVRIQTGKNTPFGSISGTSDLPTEKVGVTVSITEGSGTQNPGNDSSTNNNTDDEDIEYPAVGDLVDEIEEDQSESAESAANRRFNNEEE